MNAQLQPQTSVNNRPAQVDRDIAHSINPLISSAHSFETVSNVSTLIETLGYMIRFAEEKENMEVLQLTATFAAALNYEADALKAAWKSRPKG